MSNSFAYIKDHYKMPWLKRGIRVCSTDNGKQQWGRVTSTIGAHVRIRYDGETKYSHIFHPCYELVYFDEQGNILGDYRRGEQKGQTLVYQPV